MKATTTATGGAGALAAVVGRTAAAVAALGEAALQGQVLQNQRTCRLHMYGRLAVY